MGGQPVNSFTWTLAALATAVGIVTGSYFYGHATGVEQQARKQNTQTVADLTGLIASHNDLINKAATASRALRAAAANRSLNDAKTTKDIRNALASSASSRGGCVFSDDVMQQLATARDRAAKAAAGGVDRSVPATASEPGRPGG